MLQTILFDHDDMDGAGCRIVFQLAHQHLKEGKDYIIVHCSNVGVDSSVTEIINRDDVNEDTVIYFADICASREVMEMVAKKFKTVRVFDHHRTNFFVSWIIPDAVIIPENPMGVMESGTSLLFQHFCEIAADNPYDPRALYFMDNTSLKKAIDHSVKHGYGTTETMMEKYEEGTDGFQLFSELVDNIRSYDTYEWKEKDNIVAKKLQMLFFLLGMDRFCNKYISRIKNPSNKKTVDIIDPSDMEFVDAKLEAEKRVIDSIGIDDIYDVSIKGLRAAFILSSAGANISEVAHQFLTKHPEFDMFIGFTFYRGGEYSFRCIRDDLDTGKDIAAPIGGGGHPKASGAPIPSQVRNNIIDILMSGIDSEYIANFQWSGQQGIVDGD